MIKQDFIPVSNKNRPQNPMDPQGLLWHTTNNWNKTANAEMHSKYLKSGQSGDTGWHVTVDADQAIQHIPFNENGWHAGDGSQGHYNRNWIGQEICTNLVTSSQKLDDATYQNAVKTAAEIVKQFSFSRDQVQPHNVVKGKNCSWDKHFDRDQFRDDVFKLVETEILSTPTTTVKRRNAINAPKVIVDGILNFPYFHIELNSKKFFWGGPVGKFNIKLLFMFFFPLNIFKKHTN